MSKSITRNTPYMSLLENSLYELFSPSSTKALIDYRGLALINVDQLKVMDFNQLKLLDLKEFDVLDLPVLSTFFQYIGALFLTMSLGFMVAFGAFALHSTYKETILAEEIPSADIEHVQLTKTERKMVSKSGAGFETLISSNQVKSNGSESAVLGAATDTASESAIISASKSDNSNACSFRVVEGKKSARYSSGGRYSPAKVFKLCVDSNQRSSVYGWSLGTDSLSNTSDCVTSYELSEAKDINVTLLDDSGNVSGSCELSLVKTSVIAVNN